MGPHALLAVIASSCIAMMVGGMWTRADAAEPATRKYEPVPKEWSDYGVLTALVLQRWLSEKTEPGERLHNYLDGAYLAGEGNAVTLLMSIWLTPEGRVSRIEHAPFLHPQPNEDLREIIIGRQLPARPPSDMKFPMRLQLRLRIVPRAG